VSNHATKHTDRSKDVTYPPMAKEMSGEPEMLYFSICPAI